MSDEQPILFPLDASSGNPYALGHGMRCGVLVTVDPLDGFPITKPYGIGYMEPRNWRFSDLGQVTAWGMPDRRMEFQLIAEEGPTAFGSAPFGQPEYYDPKNRSTRVIDADGRVALLSQQLQVMESADGRYCLGQPLESQLLTGFGGRGQDELDEWISAESLLGLAGRRSIDNPVPDGLGYVMGSGAPMPPRFGGGGTRTPAQAATDTEPGPRKIGPLSSVFAPCASRITDDDSYGIEGTLISSVLPLRWLFASTR